MLCTDRLTLAEARALNHTTQSSCCPVWQQVTEMSLADYAGPANPVTLCNQSEAREALTDMTDIHTTFIITGNMS